MLKRWSALAFVFVLFVCSVAGADDPGHNGQRSDEACPVGLVSGMDLNAEFGPGADAITRCLERRHKVKFLVQLNRFCRDNVPDAQCSVGYGLRNLEKAIEDYEITHGMVAGRDYDIVAIAHDGGGKLMIKDEVKNYLPTGGNRFEGQISTLMAMGVKFYLCQNATRALIAAGLLTQGNVTNEIIPGTEFVTSAVTALADFQALGFRYVQP